MERERKCRQESRKNAENGGPVSLTFPPPKWLPRPSVPTSPRSRKELNDLEMNGPPPDPIRPDPPASYSHVFSGWRIRVCRYRSQWYVPRSSARKGDCYRNWRRKNAVGLLAGRGRGGRQAHLSLASLPPRSRFPTRTCSISVSSGGRNGGRINSHSDALISHPLRDEGKGKRSWRQRRRRF